MNFKSVLVIFLMTLPLSTIAQKDYALTIKGDTLDGALKLMPYDQLDRVQIIVNGKKTYFTALQVKAFFQSGTMYQTMKYENSYHFMKLIKPGYLSLLAFRFANQNSWDGQYLAKKDGSGMEVPNLGFKKMLSKYLSDCADVSGKLDKGDLSKRDLERIIDLYNTCIQTKTESMTNKPTPTLAIDSDKVLAVKDFVGKVEQENFVTKKDALDMLKDILSKVSKNEPVPNYLIEGLKSYLADTPSLSKELDSVVALLKK